MKTCPRCGSTHIEELGKKPGDFKWWLCRDCSLCWDDEKEEKAVDRARHQDCRNAEIRV